MYLRDTADREGGGEFDEPRELEYSGMMERRVEDQSADIILKYVLRDAVE